MQLFFPLECSGVEVLYHIKMLKQSTSTSELHFITSTWLVTMVEEVPKS